MFTRRRLTESQEATEPEVRATGGKGRPTPKRREAERSRQQRVRIPADRREAARMARERRRAERESARRGLVSGDERALPPRDRGPVRKFVRDTVDARRSPGEFFLYIAFLVLGLSFVQSPAVRSLGLLVMIALTAVIATDSLLFGRRLRRRLRERFPQGETAGAIGYGILRTTQIRRLRLPPPQVSPRRRRASSSG